MPKVGCALCNVEITIENDTDEHVIPNAIGGRKKIKGFICRSCNSKTGHQWDSELARQFGSLCLLLGISRAAGRIQPKKFVTTNSEEVVLYPDGSMSFARPHVTRSKERIHITNIPKGDAQKYIRSLERKYPTGKLDVGEGSTYLSGLLRDSWSLGGPYIGRSIVKSALALAVEYGVNPMECERARGYLLNHECEACFWYYYARDLVVNRPYGEPFHCVFVKSDPVARQLMGYVELFGFLRMIVCLSDNYLGSEFENGYSVDPLTGKSIELVVDLESVSRCIPEVSDLEKDDDNFREAVNGVLSVAYRNYSRRVQGKVVNDAIAHALENLGLEEGEVLTSDHAKRLSELMMEVIGPFVMHSLGHRLSAADLKGFTSAYPDR